MPAPKPIGNEVVDEERIKQRSAPKRMPMKVIDVERQ